VTFVTVTQALLPALWRDGHLGGRHFTVLMTRLPMDVLQHRLDAAAALHRQSATLSDFRAPEELVRLEREALSAADAIVTPHQGIAALFGARAVLLPWEVPKAAKVTRRPERMIAFPGPTAGRKGAFALREAVKRLDLEVLLQGSDLEGEDFWSGLRVRREMPQDWMSRVAAMVQPAFLEDQPRRLLHALASGVPVVATPACGIPAQDGLTLVEPGDVDALTDAIAAWLPN
jgi:glycosyltransferase involved in cell wall biosynthesis